MKICGIHTRLQNIIDKSGGYNRIESAKSLMKEYHIDNFGIAYEIAKNENIREKIRLIGLKDVIKSANKNIYLREIKLNAIVNVFGGLN